MMVILGVGVGKMKLLEIASKANMNAEDTPWSNMIRIPSIPGIPARLHTAAAEMGCTAEMGEIGTLVIKEA